MKKALIIGGGFAGCASAHQLMLLGGWDVTLVEAADHLGAGNRTMFIGGHPCTYGPRHFLTQNEETFLFLDKYVKLRKCKEHQFKTFIESDQEFYNYPIHYDDIAIMPESKQIYKELEHAKKIIELDDTKSSGNSFIGPRGAENLEEFWIRSVGPTLYEKFVKNYSKKMWALSDNTLIDDFGWSPKGVALKKGPREAWDQAISAYPISITGYDEYFKISTEGVNVLLNTQIEHYDIPNKRVTINGEVHYFDIIVSSISPDILFEQCFGELPYLGRDIEYSILPVENALPENVYFAYYAGKEPFTRIVEYKKFTQFKSPYTLISKEYVTTNGKYYPMPFKKEIERAQKYFDLMPEGVFSVGRAGKYRYGLDIDDCIEHSFDVRDYAQNYRRIAS